MIVKKEARKRVTILTSIINQIIDKASLYTILVMVFLFIVKTRLKQDMFASTVGQRIAIFYFCRF